MRGSTLAVLFLAFAIEPTPAQPLPESTPADLSSLVGKNVQFALSRLDPPDTKLITKVGVAYVWDSSRNTKEGRAISIPTGSMYYGAVPIIIHCTLRIAVDNNDAIKSISAKPWHGYEKGATGCMPYLAELLR